MEENELARAGTLAGLAQQAQAFVMGAAQNMMQLGRVLCEARPLVKQGGWEQWVAENAGGMSERTAQNLMAAYRRYGNTPILAGVDKSKVFAMLALPEGQEEKFLTENDVESMTARQVKDAVQKARDEMQATIDNEIARREAAEKRAEDAESRSNTPPQELIDALHAKNRTIENLQDEIDRARDSGSEAAEEMRRAERERNEMAELLHESEANCEDLRKKLLDAQSAAAKGDAERTVTETLTARDMQYAVGSFMGIVSQMPYMGSVFAGMPQDEYELFAAALDTVDDWCRGARNALNHFAGGGVVA